MRHLAGRRSIPENDAANDLLSRLTADVDGQI